MCIKLLLVHIMRTNIVIDDHLMSRAIRSGPFGTKREAVEEGLKLVIQLRGQKKIRNARGTLKWKGNLERMRLDR